MEKLHERRFEGSPLIMNHTDIITGIAKQMDLNVYIEFGYAGGENFDEMVKYCKEAHVVDIEIRSPRKHENAAYHTMKTDDFSENILPKLGKIDMAFIDADHESGQVMRDFDNLFASLDDNGIIFMHDTYPLKFEFTRDINCSDSYRVPKMIREKYGDKVEMVTIPISPGLTIIRKVHELDFMKENRKYTNP